MNTPEITGIDVIFKSGKQVCLQSDLTKLLADIDKTVKASPNSSVHLMVGRNFMLCINEIAAVIPATEGERK